MTHTDHQANPRYLRKVGADDYLYPWTPGLAARRDMTEVADPKVLPRDNRVSIDPREAEVLGITSKNELIEYAHENGIELSGNSTTVHALQKEIRIALLNQDEDEAPPMKKKPKAGAKKKAQAEPEQEPDQEPEGGDASGDDPV